MGYLLEVKNSCLKLETQEYFKMFFINMVNTKIHLGKFAQNCD